MMVTVTVPDLEHANRIIGRIDKRFKNMGIVEFGKNIKKFARKYIQTHRRYAHNPEKSRSMWLENTIKVNSLRRGRTVVISINHEHFEEIDKGRGAIEVRAPKVLRFYSGRYRSRNKGSFIFTRRVGRSTPLYLSRAIERYIDVFIEKYISKRIERIIKSRGYF